MVDDVSFTVFAELKKLMKKFFVSSKVHIILGINYFFSKFQVTFHVTQYDSNDKILNSFGEKINWCALMGNGKMPSNPLFKVAMVGFEKYLKHYLKCPIKNQIKFEKVIPDPKILIFLPSLKFRFNLLLEGESPDKLKDHVNFTFTATILEN